VFVLVKCLYWKYMNFVCKYVLMWDSRATHALVLLPEALAFVSFDFFSSSSTSSFIV
jgi:hypothetical protein